MTGRMLHIPGLWSGRLPPGTVVAAAAAVIVASLVAMDPYLSSLVPRAWWRLLFLENSPYRITPLLPLLAVLLAAGVWGLRRTGSLPAAALLLLLIAGQTNGIHLGPLDLLDLTLIGVFLLWLASRIADPAAPVIGGVVVWASLALLILNLPNILHESPVTFLGGTVGLVRCVLVVTLVLNLVTSARAYDFAIRALIAVAVASAVVGIVQFGAGYLFGAYFTLIDPPETAFKPTPLGMVMRASALCITAQHYSGFLTLTLPFILFACTRGSIRSRAAMVMALGIVLAGILASWNFGAIFVAAAIFGVFPFFCWPRFAIQTVIGYALAAGVAYFTGLLELVYDLSFGDSGVAKGVSQRKTLMELGLNKLYRDPWIGEGAHGMADYSGNFWGRPVHNAYLQTMTEIGMLGGWVLIGMLLLLTTQLFIAGAMVQSRMTHHLRAGLIAVLALMMLMMSEPMMDHNNTWLVLGLAEGALLIALRRGPAFSTRDSR